MGLIRETADVLTFGQAGTYYSREEANGVYFSQLDRDPKRKKKNDKSEPVENEDGSTSSIWLHTLNRLR